MKNRKNVILKKLIGKTKGNYASASYAEGGKAMFHCIFNFSLEIERGILFIFGTDDKFMSSRVIIKKTRKRKKYRKIIF
jgi:hypothetical protein